MYGSFLPDTVMNTGPRGEPAASLTALSASSNAASATCGAAPRPGTGSSRWKNPDSCDLQPELAGDLVRVVGILDAIRELARPLGDLLIGELRRERLLNLRAHLVERLRRRRPACPRP